MGGSNQSLNTESEENEIIKSFEELSLHPKIITISENKRQVLKELSKHYKEIKERFLKYRKELIRVCSILKRDKGIRTSIEKYKEMCRENLYGEFNEKLEVQIPHDFEMIKVMHSKFKIILRINASYVTYEYLKIYQYSVKKIDNLLFFISLCDEEQDIIQKFLRNFCNTQIRELHFQGKSIKIENEYYSPDSIDSDRYIRVVYPCSNIFLELRCLISRVTLCIEIWDLELKSKEFSQLIKAAKQTKELEFCDCKILTDFEFDFKQMDGCQIEKIKIGYIYQVYDTWKKYEDCLMQIFLAIIHCPNLIKSLKYINFSCNESMKIKLLGKAKEVLGDKYKIIMPSLEYL